MDLELPVYFGRFVLQLFAHLTEGSFFIPGPFQILASGGLHSSLSLTKPPDLFNLEFAQGRRFRVPSCFLYPKVDPNPG